MRKIPGRRVANKSHLPVVRISYQSVATTAGTTRPGSVSRECPAGFRPRRFAMMDSAMTDLSQETEALARCVADARHVTVDAAIRQALEASAHAAGVLPEPGRPRDPSSEAITIRREGIGRVVHEIEAMPLLDTRSQYEIMDDLVRQKGRWISTLF
jgi:antitoxin VapB